MLDIKFIRENPVLIRDAARKKRIQFDVDQLLEVDDLRRRKITDTEALRAQLNATSDAIAQIKDKEEKSRAIEKTRDLKKELSDRERELGELDKRFFDLMHLVPNVPDPSVPDGDTDAQNKEVSVWGQKPKFDFTPKDHITLMRDLDLADFDRGTKVSGFRGYFLKREGALLSMALWQFAFSRLVQKGFVPLLAPSLAREENFWGTGYFPQGIEEIYRMRDDELALVGTAEVAVMGMFRDEVLEESEFPKKFIAFSPCFRREAGSHGKDTKGLYRVHEFWKAEQVVLTRADHMESVKLHEEITQHAKELLEALGLHYRVVVNCGGDLGLGQVKKYDIETWIPSLQKYGETHSASYFHDFQTRRLNIRYKDKDGTTRFAHSLNNTALASPRILINIIEQNQQADGSVVVPEVLRPYVGTDVIKR